MKGLVCEKKRERMNEGEREQWEELCLGAWLPQNQSQQSRAESMAFSSVVDVRFGSPRRRTQTVSSELINDDDVGCDD